MNGTPVVIYNPAAARGRAARREGELRQRLPAAAVILITRAQGDAAALAESAIAGGARWILAAGGDGTVHEVTQGILAANVPDVAFTPLPLGSMNDYAYTLGLIDWWHSQRPWSDLQTMHADVGFIRSGPRVKHFVNCCGLGFNGMVTIEARKIRWLAGVPLYAAAVLQAMMKHYHKPMMTAEIDGVATRRKTLAFTFGIGQREGGFRLTSRAKLDDGLLDYLQVGSIHSWEIVRYLPRMITGNLPKNHAKIHAGQGRLFRIASEAPLCIHADGEFFSVPEEGIASVEITLEPRRLQIAFDPASLYGRSGRGLARPDAASMQSHD